VVLGLVRHVGAEFAPDDAMPDALILRGGQGSGDEWVREYAYNETANVYIYMNI